LTFALDERRTPDINSAGARAVADKGRGAAGAVPATRAATRNASASSTSPALALTTLAYQDPLGAFGDRVWRRGQWLATDAPAALATDVAGA
jgi:hypothetical protein